MKNPPAVRRAYDKTNHLKQNPKRPQGLGSFANKRSMISIYQHCGEKHLHRYVAEFDFRYNGPKLNYNERRDAALRGIEGKRLTYRRINKAA